MYVRAWNVTEVEGRKAWFQPLAFELEEVCESIEVDYQGLWRLGMLHMLEVYFTKTGVKRLGPFAFNGYRKLFKL